MKPKPNAGDERVRPAKPKAGAASRKRGRPPQACADGGRQGLIDVARDVYAVTDPARVTRQMIADRARVDPNLIRYYFGNMDQLMAEVVADTHRRARAKMFVARELKDPVKRLGSRIKRIFNLFSDQPHHHEMVVSTLYKNEQSPAHDEWVRFLRGSLDDLKETIDLGVEQGSLRPLDSRFLHMMIIATCEFWASNEPVVQLICGPGASADKLRAAYIRFVQDMIVRGTVAETRPFP